MPGNVILDERRPIQVLHDGRWLDGWLEDCGMVVGKSPRRARRRGGVPDCADSAELADFYLPSRLPLEGRTSGLDAPTSAGRFELFEVWR
jgi:hypothetical protein